MKRINKNIIWLASYPKSGNTWFRVFLSNLLSDSSEPVNINQLLYSPITSCRALIDYYLGSNSSDLTPEEIECLRPTIYRKLSEENKGDVFMKTHDAWKQNINKEPIFPTEVSKGVLYFIRNPLDVAVSFAFHNDIALENAIKNMNESDFGLCLNTTKLVDQIPQHLYSWSDHVISWVVHSGLTVYVIRFEDMIDYPLLTFTKALNYLNIEVSQSKLETALYNSSFKVLAMQEEKYGFQEKTSRSKRFFRSGLKNDWKNHLSLSHVYQVVRQHRSIMEKFGYLREISFD